MNAVQPHALSPYLSLHHRGWLARPDSSRYQVVDGTLLFLDISGFTPLTERLARRGKAGAEELTDHLNVVFGGLIGLAANHGGDVLKFGGDALFILLTGDGHEARGAAAAWDLQIGMARFKRLRTSVGTIPLQASSGLASGPVYLFRAGSVFDELIVAGPTVTTCLQLEKVAEATEVLVDPVAVAAFGDEHCTVAPDRGLLLTSRPDAGPPPASHEALLADPLRGLPSILHDELAHSELGEHRQAVVSFVQFKGVDEMLDADGPSPVSTALDALMAAVQEACERHGVTFICTDADLAAGKVMLTAGAPVAHEDDADRMLLAVCEIVAHEGPLTLRAGVNAGRVFAVHIGAPSRRTYSTMGDTTNLAARVMGKSPNGRVLGTRAVLHRARGHFETQAVDPFKVKGKSMLIDAEVVIGPDATATAQVAADAGDLAVPPGRDREAAALAAATRTALAGGVSVVELCGAPGIGKSRLLAHGIAVARDAGLRTVRLEGTAYGAHTPYAAARTPLRELLGVADGDAAAVTDALTRAAAGLEDWLGLLGPVVGVDLPLSTRAARLDPEAAARRRRFVGARLLARLLDKPTLVVVEDSHWLDTATSELLETTLASGELRACAIVCGRRPDPGGFVAAEELHPVRIDLAPISDEAARAVIVAVIAAGGGLTPDAVPALVERAAGNPLLLRELAAAVSAGGDLRALPDTIEGLLAASIDRLAPTDRTILRRLAVLGVSSDLATAARYLDVSGAELHAATGRLAAFVEEERRTDPVSPRPPARGGVRGAAVPCPPRPARACRRRHARGRRRRRRCRRRAARVARLPRRPVARLLAPRATGRAPGAVARWSDGRAGVLRLGDRSGPPVARRRPGGSRRGARGARRCRGTRRSLRRRGTRVRGRAPAPPRRPAGRRRAVAQAGADARAARSLRPRPRMRHARAPGAARRAARRAARDRARPARRRVRGRATAPGQRRGGAHAPLDLGRAARAHQRRPARARARELLARRSARRAREVRRRRGALGACARALRGGRRPRRREHGAQQPGRRRVLDR